ncbi:MAG: transcription termination factor Rho, partial [Solirubrobacterales bacterium]|nr:transcription termination factor Rho [Solirubrobacterales bacterium]
RPPRRGERHRALVHVDQVNGGDAEAERPNFDELAATMPKRRLPLATDDVLARAADALAPLAFGQRVLVDAAPRSGRTTFLRTVAAAVQGADGAKLVVLLVDERPEEATAWREALPEAELAIATAEMSAVDQLRTADLALARARRLAERGADAVLVVDSLSRIAVAADGDTAIVKRIFGSGRELEGDGPGSLTVIATTLARDDEAHRAVSSTENALVVLSPELAAAGVTPALDAGGTRASNEEEILSADELESLRALRAELSGLEPADAAAKLRERVS